MTLYQTKNHSNDANMQDFPMTKLTPKIYPEDNFLWDRMNENKNITNIIKLTNYIRSDSKLKIENQETDVGNDISLLKF